MLKINESFYHLKGRDLFVHKNHSHNEIEIIQVVTGSGIVVKNDKTYILKNQHIYVIDARNTHIVYPQPVECRTYVRNKIVIDADSFMSFFGSMGLGEILEELFDSEPISTASCPRIDEIYRIVSGLMKSKKTEDKAFAQGYISELIHWISVNSERNPCEENSDSFQKMLGIINEKGGLTSLSEISSLLHLDKYYLCRLFKEKTGITLSEYLSGKVLEKARKLLEDTSYSIDEISCRCGFSSQSSFTRFFRNKCGISPSAYRKKSDVPVKLNGFE